MYYLLGAYIQAGRGVDLSLCYSNDSGKDDIGVGALWGETCGNYLFMRYIFLSITDITKEITLNMFTYLFAKYLKIKKLSKRYCLLNIYNI